MNYKEMMNEVIEKLGFEDERVVQFCEYCDYCEQVKDEFKTQAERELDKMFKDLVTN